jgi:N-acetylglucosaminyl-diphospho-decaprenol L-rhamnosyltransferase
VSEAAVTVSVVSHRQNELVNQVIADLDQHCRDPVHLVLTENVPDVGPLKRSKIHTTDVITNRSPKGFGANHNAAFQRCCAPFYCVLNPDVRITTDPFPPLIQLASKPTVGAVGPLVRTPSGKIEDSARRFPTLGSLGRKLFIKPSGLDYPYNRGPTRVDWIAGMFLLFRSDIYDKVKGFDERYFLYYEDVDLCRRLCQAGFEVVYAPDIEVIHDARRDSHRNVRLAIHHVRSLVRYLSSASELR